MGCIGLIGNDFGSLELRRRGVGRPDAELDALFELSVPAEPDALVEIFGSDLRSPGLASSIQASH